MTGAILYRLARVIGPVAFHFLVINMIQMAGLHADAAFLTTLAAVIVLPFFFRDLLRDECRRNPEGRSNPDFITLNAGAFLRKSGQKPCVFWGIRKGMGYRRLQISETAEIMLLALGCNFTLTRILNLLEGAFAFSNEAQEALLGSNLAVQVIGLGFWVPVMEEVLFRGLVYQRLKDYNKGWLSALLAAAVFAVYHGNVIQILFAFPMGGILILVYERWKTLKAPILFHMTVNLSSVLVTAWLG